MGPAGDGELPQGRWLKAPAAHRAMNRRTEVRRIRPCRRRRGSGSGPGSRPPAYFTSALTRESTDGWVANRSAKPSRGLSMHISMTAEVAPGNSPRPSILRSAEIIASGLFCEFDGARVGQQFARARQGKAHHQRQAPCEADQGDRQKHDGKCAAALLVPSDEEDDDRPPPPKLQLELKKMRKNSSAKKPDHAGDDDGDHKQLHVAVADMGSARARARLPFPGR